MSDNNQDKPDDYEVIFDTSSDDDFQQDSRGDDIVEYTDINDGEDEDGIFAPDSPANQTKKSSGLLGAVALLAVVGAGGYVYYSNPQLIDQVKQNIAGVEETANIDMPSEQVDLPVDAVSAESAQAMGKELDSVVADVKKSDESVAAQGQDAQDSPLAPEVVPEVAEAKPQPAEPVVDTKIEMKVAAGAEGNVLDVDPPSMISESDVSIPQPVIQAAPEVPPQVVQEKVVAPKVEAAPPAKEPEKEQAKDIVKEEKPIVVESKEAQKSIADSKLDKYFDSPGGKILKDMPSPSFNPKKGKNESIIIVGKQPKTSSHSYGQTGRVSIQTTGIDSKIVAAGRALALQRYDAAKEMYDELYRLNPKDSRVLMGRAVLFQKMGNVEQATAAYEDVLKYNPDNAEAVVNLAGLIRKQYPAVALNKLLDLRQQYPDNAVVAAQLGVAYADTGNYPDAYHYLSMAASMDPNNSQHLFNMAVVAEKAGDAQKAIANYEKALEIDAVSGGGGKTISREVIYDRLTRLRGN